MKIFFALLLFPLAAFCSEYELIYKKDMGQISYNLQSEIQVQSIDESLTLIDETLFKHYQLVLKSPLASLRVVVDYVYGGDEYTLTFAVPPESKGVSSLSVFIVKDNGRLQSAESAASARKSDFDNMIEQSVQELLSKPNAETEKDDMGRD